MTVFAFSKEISNVWDDDKVLLKRRHFKRDGVESIQNRLSV